MMKKINFKRELNFNCTLESALLWKLQERLFHYASRQLQFGTRRKIFQRSVLFSELNHIKYELDFHSREEEKKN